MQKKNKKTVNAITVGWMIVDFNISPHHHYYCYCMADFLSVNKKQNKYQMNNLMTKINQFRLRTANFN